MGMNGFDVPVGIVNGGVVNHHRVSVGTRIRPSGPVRVNFTLTVCERLVQDMTVP